MSAFFLRGKGSVRWLPTISGNAGPTVAEVTAGTDLSKAVTSISGFTTQVNRIQTPVMAYKEEIQTEGPQQFVDSALNIINDDGTGSDPDSVAYAAAATLLVDGTAGYVVFCPTKQGTLAAADKVWVFPAKVGANNFGWTLDATLSVSVVDIILTSAARKKVAVLA